MRGKDHLLRVCFLGSARYGIPLNETSDKKFCALSGLGKLSVIGFAQGVLPRCFTRYARFYLLPLLPLAILRYLEMFTIAPILLLWLVFRHQVRIVIAQSPYEGACGAFVKNIAAWAGHRVVLIVESHGDFEKSFFLYREVRFQRMFSALMKKASEFSLQHADSFRAISRATREQFLQRAPGKPVEQFMAWTDIDPFLAVGEARQTRQARLFLYAGVITPTKGLIHLIRAFIELLKERPEARLLLIGREQHLEYAQELKQLVSHNALLGKIDFMPEMPQKELAHWMGQADIFVLPSLSEGLGRVIIEAMASGMPVLGSNVGGIPEIVQDGKTGFLVPPGDEAALSVRMSQLLCDPEKTDDMGREARAFAKQFFSKESYVQGYARLLRHARNILQHDFT